MARAKSKGGHVAAIVKDPAAPPATYIVGGYPGDSAHEGYERLYLTADLSAFLDIPADDVLHQMEAPGDPLGAVYVWVRRSALLLYNGQQPPEPVEEADAEGAGEETADDDNN